MWFTPVLSFNNPSPTPTAESEDNELVTDFTRWLVFLGFEWLRGRRPYLWYAAGVLEQTEIEISAHFEVRPDLLIPIYFKDFSLQAPLLKKLHWVIHTDGQFRGYSTESYSSGKPTRLTKEEKAARVCPEDIKEVITGMVIGDSCLIFSARLWQR